ncbi:TetR/AcrR family transcriptional regulator [Cytobacillus dafuensis]|uniref:TetR/AcrR family transcriptional regulator n=1 Tax=Cytobacillus dafuensis TaxID=1742359 RepID=A0A5B8Z4M6_CYTDA|nr:TetR family transcriptional regulator [Cytobacillus dafuensis]QED48015.1 TetR/AcrR family transcriptional regulator [Cytobacillus dafuensis]
MPKITFYNLPEDKKETLIHAVMKEFSRVPLYEASITNIIKSANIPRGSFYQYFENKEDAFFFLLNAVVKENKTSFLFMLKKNNGDLFETMIEFFQLIIREDENIHFLKNTFLNMTYKIETTFARSFTEEEMNEAFKEFCTEIDKSKLNISDNSELIHVLQIITAVTFRNIVAKYSRDISYEEAIENYIKEINFLKKGLYHN